MKHFYDYHKMSLGHTAILQNLHDVGIILEKSFRISNPGEEKVEVPLKEMMKTRKCADIYFRMPKECEELIYQIRDDA